MERLNLTIIITPEGFKDICYRVDLVSFCSNVLEMSSARLLSHLSWACLYPLALQKLTTDKKARDLICLIIYNVFFGTRRFFYLLLCWSFSISGSWLRVCNLVFDSYFNFSAEKTFCGLATNPNKMFLTKSAMTELKKKMSFNQLRFRFSKQQGRMFHVSTVPKSIGEAAVQYSWGETDV